MEGADAIRIIHDPKPVYWISESSMKEVFQKNPEHTKWLLETFYTLCCSKGQMTEENVKYLVSNALFFSDAIFMIEPDESATVLAAAFFMRKTAKKEIYIVLVCSHTRHGRTLLNALIHYLRTDPTPFNEPAGTYKKIVLTPITDEVVPIYEAIGFKVLRPEEIDLDLDMELVLGGSRHRS